MYSAELKLEIVQRYLQGDMGVKKLAEEYHVHKGDIQKWRDAYLERGINGLNVGPKSYSCHLHSRRDAVGGTFLSTP